MRSWFTRCCCWGAGLLLLPAAAQAVHLRGQVLQAGFPASLSVSGPTGQAGEDQDFSWTSGGHYYRRGAWVPVRVELTNDDTDRFEGWIEVCQPDADGDEVVARREVVVEGTRRFFLYVPGGALGDGGPAFRVRVYGPSGQSVPLFDDAGQPVRDLVMKTPVDVLPAQAQVILDISATPVNAMRLLLGDSPSARPVALARSLPAELPDAAAGLDIADVIVWDATDPAAMDLPQRQALIAWVRQGGTLVLTAGRHAESLARSRFAELLPAVPPPPQPLEDPPVWLAEWLRINPFGLTGGRFSPPLLYSAMPEYRLTPDAFILQPGQGVRARLRSADAAGPVEVWAAGRPCGGGRIVLLAAELRPMLAASEQPVRVLRELLEIDRVAEVHVETGAWIWPMDLFAYIRQMTAFSVTAWVYLLTAMLFVAGYILAATAGSWTWLRRRGRVHQAWLYFAGLAVLTSLLGMGAARAIRGFSYRVQELSVVDGRAGLPQVLCRGYLGLKSPSDDPVDLRLPPDWKNPHLIEDERCILRPIPPSTSSARGFAVRERYEAVAALAELRQVPTRASLKQFEISWQGTIPGQIRGRLLRLRGNSNELAAESWLENGLGVDLADCWLLISTQDPGPIAGNRAMSIEGFPVGGLQAGQRLTWQALAERHAAGRMRGPGAMSPPYRFRLGDLIQQDWLRALEPGPLLMQGSDDAGDVRLQLTAENFARTLRLVSIFREIPAQLAVERNIRLYLSAGYRLDRCREITRGQALFLGLSTVPGPARLCYRRSGSADAIWQAITPSMANVMYRYTVPVAPPSIRDVDLAPAPDATDAEPPRPGAEP